MMSTSFDPNDVPLCGDFGLAISRDGTWYYHGSPIGRKPLVKLFASVLRRDEAGEYWLVTPAERGRVAVEDVPFVAVEVTASGTGRDQVLTFRTNLDAEVEAGPENALRVDHDAARPGVARPGVARDVAASGAPAPYIHIRDGLEARILRPVYYHLVELGQEETIGGQPVFGVWSKGRFFELGPVET